MNLSIHSRIQAFFEDIEKDQVFQGMKGSPHTQNFAANRALELLENSLKSETAEEGKGPSDLIPSNNCKNTEEIQCETVALRDKVKRLKAKVIRQIKTISFLSEENSKLTEKTAKSTEENIKITEKVQDLQETHRKEIEELIQQADLKIKETEETAQKTETQYKEALIAKTEEINTHFILKSTHEDILKEKEKNLQDHKNIIELQSEEKVRKLFEERDLQIKDCEKNIELMKQDISSVSTQNKKLMEENEKLLRDFNDLQNQFKLSQEKIKSYEQSLQEYSILEKEYCSLKDQLRTSEESIQQYILNEGIHTQEIRTLKTIISENTQSTAKLIKDKEEEIQNHEFTKINLSQIKNFAEEVQDTLNHSQHDCNRLKIMNTKLRSTHHKMRNICSSITKNTCDDLRNLKNIVINELSSVSKMIYTMKSLLYRIPNPSVLKKIEECIKHQDPLWLDDLNTTSIRNELQKLISSRKIAEQEKEALKSQLNEYKDTNEQLVQFNKSLIKQTEKQCRKNETGKEKCNKSKQKDQSHRTSFYIKALEDRIKDLECSPRHSSARTNKVTFKS